MSELKDFVEHDYHNFSDDYHEDWDFAGNAKLDRFGMEFGGSNGISWNRGDEFEAARLASLK